MNVSLIIAAGGAGRRFLAGRKKLRFSKLFVPLGNEPLLRHTLESFRKIPSIREIILALPAGTESWVKTHVVNGWSGPRVRLIRGGKTRAESVRRALLRTSPQNSWVLVHDGARPFPPREAVLRLLKRPPEAEAVILARPVVSTLKRVAAKNSRVLGTVDREGLFEAETPQLVRRDFLMKAYQKNSRASLATDESSLVEALGGRVKVLSHSGWNVKVTTPEDLAPARHCEEAHRADEAISVLSDCFARHGSWRARNDARIGFGRDTHRLVAGRKFYLGGVRIPFEKGTLGHSDGDALLHAVTDAILGALGRGDIGEWFSDKDPRHKNIRSEKILAKVLKEACGKLWRPVRVDTVIILERPKLARFKPLLRKKMAKLLGLETEAVSIKAKTMEGLGPEGRGEAVTCEALVTLAGISS